MRVGLSSGTARWGDYDGDGHLDVLLTGLDPSNGQAVAKVYRQTGIDTFAPLAVDPLEGLSSGSAAWGDYDSNGRMDVMATGIDASGRFVAVPLLGFADGTLVRQPQLVLEGVSSGAVAWGDYDDGQLDMAVAAEHGFPGPNGPLLRIYRNLGNGDFAGVSSRDVFGAMTWADYDNDGRLDLFVSMPSQNGSMVAEAAIPRLFRSLADGTFAEVSVSGGADPLNGVNAWAVAGIDADGRVDALGAVSGGVHFIRNVTAFPVPDGVFATPGDEQIELFWNAPATGSDAPIINYSIQYSGDAGATWATISRPASTATSAVVSGLTNDQTYLFRVAAVREATIGPYSTPLAITPFGVSSEDDFITTVANGVVTITGYRGLGGNVNIPATIGDLPVRAIGANAFAAAFFVPGQSTPLFESVVIPAGVLAIGDAAFAGQMALESASFPESLQSIGSRAFDSYGYSRLTGIALPAALHTVDLTTFDGFRMVTAWVDPANAWMQSVEGLVYDKAPSRWRRSAPKPSLSANPWRRSPWPPGIPPTRVSPEFCTTSRCAR